MNRTVAGLVAIIALAGTPGCLGFPLAPGQQAAGRITVSGVVMAPTRSLPVTLERSTMEPDALSPVTGASVIVADGKGKPLPGAIAVLTDSFGHYTLPDVEIGRTQQILATFRDGQGQDITLRALAVADPANTTAHLNPATTSVTDALLAGDPEALGPMDRTTYQVAVTLTQTMMARQGTPSLSDRASLRANVARLAGQLPELGKQMDGLSRSLLGGKAFATAVGPELIDTYKASTPTPFYVFFNDQTIVGDAMAEDYKGWIQGYDLIWNGDVPETGTVPGAMPVAGGRPIFGSLSFTKHVDATMPKLFDAMVRQLTFPVVTIVQTVMGGDKMVQLRKLNLGDVYITGITLSDRSTGTLPLEEVRIGFSSLRLTETQIDPLTHREKGTVATTYNLLSGRQVLPDGSQI
jgi:type VI protein secretion system component Hcp